MLNGFQVSEMVVPLFQQKGIEMNTQETANFAIETIKAAKVSMIENGFSDAELIYAVCNKLSSMLMLPFEIIVEIFEKA